MQKELTNYVRKLGQGIAILEAAIEADNDYWEAVAIGQNTEQAESSGYLVGFRDALSAVHTAFAYSDISTLENYLASVQDLAAEQLEEIATSR